MTRNPPAGKKQKEKKVTVRTIAEMTGYAHCTVARALADRGNVAEETRRRIVRIAMEAGYVNKSEPVVALILPPFGREISTSLCAISTGRGAVMNSFPNQWSGNSMKNC